MTPTSSSSTFVANNQNVPAVIVSGSTTTINVSATEFFPTTTLPDSTYSTAVNENSASNPYPPTNEHLIPTSASPTVPQTEMNMGQTSFDPGQTPTNIYQHPNTDTLVNPRLSVSPSSTTFQHPGTSNMANLPRPVNPSVTTSPQYPGSNMFYPSRNVNSSISPLHYPHSHTTLSQLGITTISKYQFTGFNSTTTSPSTANPWTYPTPPIQHSNELYTGCPVTVTSVPQSASQCPPTSLSPQVQVKKHLPTFNGYRKDWPELKTIWKSVAETAFFNKTALAHELKRSVKGEASKRIRSVYVTKPEAYDVMWQRLENYNEDVGTSVQAALEDLHELKEVSDDDYKGLVELVDKVESAYCQLEELGNLSVLTMRDVDFITELLPSHLKVEW